MTSGSFSSVPISSIFINREERQRRVLDDKHIDELASSIAKRGLIHPPVIQRTGELVVGECRLQAARDLGWTHIPVQFTDELDPQHLRSIELEENLRRKNLDWPDECAAVREIHSLRKMEDPSHTLEDTGKELGYSGMRIQQILAVAKGLVEGDDVTKARIKASANMSKASGVARRAAERAKTSSLIGITEAINPPDPSADPIITTDFREWAPTYTGPKFNFIHCDFPYGIGADKFVQGGAPTHGGYADDEGTYWSLVKCLLSNIDALCNDSCHFMFWFSMHYYSDTIRAFDQCGITLDRFPLVWIKSDNVGIIPDPQRGPRRVYETAFFGSRGDRKIVSPVANGFSGASDRGEHMSVKPVPMLSHFFRLFIDGSTLMLDPTCGSGSSVRAAKRLGARMVTGLEINPEFADRARLACKAETKEKIA